MRNIFTKLAVLSIAIVCGGVVCSCKESYISPDYIVPSDTIPYEIVEDPVPVMLALNDPSYVSITRGMGAIAPDNAGSKEDARFYVYSFLANNYAFPKENGNDVDYTRTYQPADALGADEPMYCLIDNPETGMGAQVQIQTDNNDDVLNFVDSDITYFYDQRFQEYKYKFFCYHLDDAEILSGGAVREKDNIHMNIRIDGTQDVIYSVADTTNDISNINPVSEKWILKYVRNGELLFSTLTGHRHILPVFRAKHAMVRFTFNLIGEETLEDDSVFIQDIYVKAKRDWKLTVAADDETRLGLSKLYDDEPEVLETVHLCDDIGEIDGSKPSFEKDKYYVKKDKPLSPFGMGMLLPSRSSYELFVECTSMKDGVERKYTARYDLTHRVETEDENGKKVLVNRPFEAGSQYNVTMHVYGFRKINMSIDGLGWEMSPDNEIEIPEDDVEFE